MITTAQTRLRTPKQTSSQTAEKTAGQGQQTCHVCQRPDKFDFHVPDDIWAQIVPPEYRNRVVCLGCFDDFAVARGIAYASHLAATLWFAGNGASFKFQVESANPGVRRC